MSAEPSESEQQAPRTFLTHRLHLPISHRMSEARSHPLSLGLGLLQPLPETEPFPLDAFAACSIPQKVVLWEMREHPGPLESHAPGTSLFVDTGHALGPRGLNHWTSREFPGPISCPVFMEKILSLNMTHIQFFPPFLSHLQAFVNSCT